MQNHKSLTKIYCIRSIYFSTAAFANILAIVKTHNFSVAMLGVFLYYTPIAIENYAKSTNSTISVILRRIGYMLPSLFLFFNVFVSILVINFQQFSDVIEATWYITVLIIVSLALIIASVFDIFIYGFNKKNIHSK